LAGSFAGNVEVSRDLKVSGNITIQNVNVLPDIQELQRQVATLRQQVAVLQRLLIPVSPAGQAQFRAAVQQGFQGNGDLVYIGLGFQALETVDVFITSLGAPPIPSSPIADEFGMITDIVNNVCTPTSIRTFEVSGTGRTSNRSGISHIPTDLVVAQEASSVESSSRLDFLLLHNLGMSFVAP
jgi:hypothetical protein